MAKLLKKERLLSFVLASILIAGFGVRLYKIDNPVADWHAWRQADTASVSKIFINEGIDLLRPRYHDISKIQTGYENPVGYRFVEFPVYNAIHALISQAFPILPFEMWGRLVSVAAALLTALFLYGIGRRVYGVAVGFLTSFFYLFLPYNIYFTRVILPDPLAVMFATASLFMFIVYADTRKTRSLLISALLFAVALLVKPHTIFYAVPIGFIAITKFRLRELVKNKWHFIALDIALIPFLLWRVWIYQEGLIRGVVPWGWALNSNGIRFRPSFWNWIFGERLGKLILGFWGVFPFMLGIVHTKKMLTLVHAMLLGTFLYLSIFATANVMHDYYQVFIIPSIALALAIGVWALWTNREFNPIISKLAIFPVILLMFFISFYQIRNNYRVNDTGILEVGRVANEVLPKDALVIAPYNGDTAFLYQTNRRGWPVVTTSIDEMIEMGADYYISVNLTDADTTNFKQRFEAVRETEKYIILDLHKEKGK